MNSMETRWVKGGGRKGGNVIFRSEGNSGRFFKFVYHKDLAESVLRWTCAQRTSAKCGAFLKTLGEQVIFASEVHAHEPPNDFDVVELRTSVKRKACEDISTAPRKVIRRAVMENPDMSPNVRDVINLRYVVYKQKRKRRPTLPKSAQEVFSVLREMKTETSRGDEFLLHADSETGIVIFSCLANMQCLVSCSVVYMDGTFKFCTKFFYQFFTLHGHYNGAGASPVSPLAGMDSLMPVSLSVKTEPEMPVQVVENEELIVPDITPSSMEGPGFTIKKEPTESVCEGEVLENPYQCFTCGLDCESQHDLIIHYESKCWAQDVVSNSESMEADGGDDLKAEETDADPLIGDEAPSNERVQNIGHAFDNGEGSGPQQLLFYCAFCGVASNEKQELMVHMESHVEVTYLSCAHCVHVYSDKYHLKNYKCRDEFEKPHVCVHCPFRTQWWQELKDHCFSHHHNDMNVPQDVNRAAFVDHQASTVPHNRSPGSSPSIHSTESLVNPNPNLQNQVLNVHHANKEYVVVIKNLGPNGSEANSTNLQTSGNGSAAAKLPSNDDYLKQLLVSNSLNAVAGPLLQSSMNLNSVSSTKPNKRKTPPLVPVNAIVQPPTPLYISPVKREIHSDEDMVPAPVAQSWPTNVRNIAPRPPNVPGPQNLPTVIPREPPRPQVILPPKPVKVPKKKIPNGNPKKKITHVNKKIPCPYCEYLSRDRWNLRTHILTHTKEKPFACELCSYRASQAAHLRKHMQIHGRRMLGK